jgi:hypothetical protein
VPRLGHHLPALVVQQRRSFLGAHLDPHSRGR